MWPPKPCILPGWHSKAASPSVTISSTTPRDKPPRKTALGEQKNHTKNDSTELKRLQANPGHQGLDLCWECLEGTGVEHRGVPRCQEFPVPLQGICSSPACHPFHPWSHPKTPPNLIFYPTNRTEGAEPVGMDTTDRVPGFWIHCKSTGACRVSESQLSFGALNINQALLQNPEMLRGQSSFPLIFYLNF